MCNLLNQEFIEIDSGIIFLITEVKQKKSEPFVFYQSIWDENRKESFSLSSFITKIDNGELAKLP
ncbi:hypothetical protein HN014_22260 (plasmid) [Aquimarina sp. TRL1]|uniref:hypothetical protein n=1 Tax=Aquimarina sp. (strain TRL1) TaxID=2736252 RepID=UPI00158A7ED6|nr:hypothetical protein [Aquimarina sp. TRL1]QKX07726.1 hypothetical protein HN014_22260 [Aquimarina sp. TRL1]